MLQKKNQRRKVLTQYLMNKTNKTGPEGEAKGEGGQQKEARGSL